MSCSKAVLLNLLLSWTRSEAAPWLARLRKSGYVIVRNSGRSLEIHIQKWKPLKIRNKTLDQASDGAHQMRE
jgi:predicted mannosyl-3-phosphoglycerate phosphatase (HAD superfamily)